MKSLPVFRARTVAVASATLLGLALAGCGNASPGVVAYVGDETVTQRAVDTALAGVTSTLEEGQQVSTSAVVSAMIQGAIAEQLAGEQQLTITDADRNAVLKGSTLEPLVAVPDARPVAYDLADSEIVAQKVGSDAYLAKVAAMPVKLNPRYGVLDPAQKTIVTGQSGSLSQPAAGATP
jgi:hypothetical protein